MTEQAMTESDGLQKTLNNLILDELSHYPRFRMWVEANYGIHVLKNDENKRIEVKVEEYAADVAQENLAKAVRSVMDNKTQTPDVLVVGPEALAELKNPKRMQKKGKKKWR